MFLNNQHWKIVTITGQFLDIYDFSKYNLIYSFSKLLLGAMQKMTFTIETTYIYKRCIWYNVCWVYKDRSITIIKYPKYLIFYHYLKNLDCTDIYICTLHLFSHEKYTLYIKMEIIFSPPLYSEVYKKCWNIYHQLYWM